MVIKREIWTRGKKRIAVITERNAKGQLQSYRPATKGITVQSSLEQFNRKGTLRSDVRVKRFSSQANYIEVTRVVPSSLDSDLKMDQVPRLKREKKTRLLQYVFEATTKDGKKLYARSSAVQQFDQPSLKEARNQAFQNFLGVIHGEKNNQTDDIADYEEVVQTINVNSVKEGIVQYVDTAIGIKRRQGLIP